MKKSSYIGIDLGDRFHEVCGLDESGRVVERERVANTPAAMDRVFGSRAAVVVAMEAGTHTGWIGRRLEGHGHRVVVANPRHVRAIWDRDRKNDASDAEMLARLVRVDETLLHPVRLRSEAVQLDRGLLKVRDGLVQTRTKLINQVRGLAKTLGSRVASCDARSFASKAREGHSAALLGVLNPLIAVIEVVEQQIRALDREIVRMGVQRYPVTARLQEVPGVGPLTAAAYVVTIENPELFAKSRDVGPYLGLVPRQDQSGATDKQLAITKAGDGYLRRLLVNGSQYILGPFGPPCALRTFGLRLAARGGRNAKRRAVVAVARKLAVLLHALWVGDAPYDPNRGMKTTDEAA
jgi:transposase